MKLRIAALIAMVAVIIAIIAFLRDWHQSRLADDTAVASAVEKKANPVPAAQPIVNGDASPLVSPVPLPAQAGLPAPPTKAPPIKASIPGEQGGNVTAPVRMPGGAPAMLPAAPVSTPIPRARASPGDPLAGDADRKAGAIEVDKVGLMLRDYRTRMGENPFGTNAEIMKAIMGGNPKGAMLGPPEGQKLNGDGELVDRWGKPYFFHQLSRTSMEIRSAGPDQQMYTEDDVLAH